MAYRIREVDGDDEDVADILRALHEDVFANSAPQIKADEGFWWVALDGEAPVGFAGLRYCAGTPGSGYLNRSGVVRAHRGRGLQRRFIRVREAKAKRLGLVRLVTDTTQNSPSSNNLIRAGYRLFDPIEPWAMRNSLYWEKRLFGD